MVSTYVYAERGREALAASPVAEFVVLYDKSYTLNCAVHTIKKHSYIEGLEANGISKTIYHEFMGFTHSEKAFDKKLFVNMAFLLGLSYPLAERLLNLNGYTFEGSERAFDKLCAKGFKLGFGRELTNALIDKRNIELGGDRIPNLQKNSKELNIAKLLAP